MQVAARFELARCGWDWRRPQAAYIRAQQLFATPAFGAQLARAADPVSWRAEVLAGRQTVTCALRDVRRAVGAPPSATQAYVRVIFAASVVSARGRFETGPGTAAWRVVRTGAGWRVAGPFVGG